MNSKPLLISVVIPAFNEQERINGCLVSLTEFMNGQDYMWEVVVCNDGSTDNTSRIVHNLALLNSNIQLLDLPHQGKGGAVQQGMLQAKGDLRILCDADFSMPVCRINRLIKESDFSDIVIASRELNESKRFNEPFKRHLMGRVFNVLTRLIVLPKIKDSQCGFKLFRSHTVEPLFGKLCVSGFAFDVELLAKARKQGFSVAEVAIDWYYYEGSKVRMVRDTCLMFWDLLRIAVVYRIFKH